MSKKEESTTQETSKVSNIFSNPAIPAEAAAGLREQQARATVTHGAPSAVLQRLGKAVDGDSAISLNDAANALDIIDEETRVSGAVATKPKGFDARGKNAFGAYGGAIGGFNAIDNLQRIESDSETTVYTGVSDKKKIVSAVAMAVVLAGVAAAFFNSEAIAEACADVPIVGPIFKKISDFKSAVGISGCRIRSVTGRPVKPTYLSKRIRESIKGNAPLALHLDDGETFCVIPVEVVYGKRAVYMTTDAGDVVLISYAYGATSYGCTILEEDREVTRGMRVNYFVGKHAILNV